MTQISWCPEARWWSHHVYCSWRFPETESMSSSVIFSSQHVSGDPGCDVDQTQLHVRCPWDDLAGGALHVVIADYTALAAHDTEVAIWRQREQRGMVQTTWSDLSLVGGTGWLAEDHVRHDAVLVLPHIHMLRLRCMVVMLRQSHALVSLKW